MVESFCSKAVRIAAADLCGSFTRCSNGSSATNTVPEFDALVKVAPEKPTRLTALVTPGTFEDISTTRRFTSSVRASAAPGGSCDTMMR